MLGVAELLANGTVELAIVGERGSAGVEALQRAAGSVYVPPLVLAGGPPLDDVALLEGRAALQGVPTAYVCRNYACEAPVQDPEALVVQLRATRESGLRGRPA
jgi:uncharacterized protein YyaL (SSP411 family)